MTAQPVAMEARARPDEPPLTGADLALAVAQVMGLRVMRGGKRGRDTVRLVEPLLDHNGDTYDTPTREFRPDLGGADAWAVLEWVRDTGRTVSLMRTTNGGQHTYWVDLYGLAAATITGRGETGDIALCRAVAQMRRLTEVQS